MWSVGAKTSSGSRELATAFGLPGQVCCVGQEACWRSVVCRDKFGEWVKRIVGGVWSVGAKSLSGSRKLSAGCGLSGRKGRVGQEACWRSVVCRGENVAWVKGIGGGVWSVGAKRASGSKELSAEFGLSGRKGRVGQENCWRSVVCRDKFVAWVKGIGGGCGLSAQVCCVGQENCRRVWSVGSSMASESRGLSVGVVCRGENVAWVKGTVARVWSVGVKRASEPKKPHISYASNVANCHSDQNCQNPQNMIHLL